MELEQRYKSPTVKVKKTEKQRTEGTKRKHKIKWQI